MNYTLLFWLLVGHFLCDFPLQGDFLSKGKNHTKPIPGVPWWICLIAHSMIQAGAVALITNCIPLAIGEFLLHCYIDFGKCSIDSHLVKIEKYRERLMYTTFTIDQIMHVVCKIVWYIIFPVLGTHIWWMN